MLVSNYSVGMCNVPNHWIVLKCGAHIHVSVRVNCNNFNDPMAFYIIRSHFQSVQYFDLWLNICKTNEIHQQWTNKVVFRAGLGELRPLGHYGLRFCPYLDSRWFINTKKNNSQNGNNVFAVKLDIRGGFFWLCVCPPKCLRKHRPNC